MGLSNQPALGWNAHRHQSSPIGQPRYRFQDVPKCQKSLEGSVIQEISNTREAFKEIMAEMVLLCTEAMKRSRSGRTAGKPLSLEYIADRLDVDDPCFGYIIRSDEGHLQGFITATTFTNWQKHFCWDSLNELSFYYDGEDDDEDGEESNVTDSLSGDVVAEPLRKKQKKTRQKGRTRVIDKAGKLAKELQKTVRLGDPYNEGIVWPRIAEISLLGGLGCGRNLVRLVVEQLEFQRGNGSANYDYIALQATDNSISFYESLGFVRVGAVVSDTKGKKPDKDEDYVNSQLSSPTASSDSIMTVSTSIPSETMKSESSKETEASTLPATKTVSSPNFVHVVVRAGETPNEVAKRFHVCVWDIIFLNKDIYPDLRPTGRLMKGTLLHVPEIEKEEKNERNNCDDQSAKSRSAETPTKWFVAKENDTPRKIAKQFNIACKKLVSANQRRLPELQATSRLKAGTRVKVSNLDKHDKVCEQYCHWSFPEDSVVEGGDPSYMMVYKLDRKTARNPRIMRDSLAVPVGKYSPPRLLFPPPPKTSLSSNDAKVDKTASKGKQLERLQDSPSLGYLAEKNYAGIKFPKAPKRPAELKKSPPESGQDIYWDHQKELHPEFTKSTLENEKIIRERWSRLGRHKKERYHGVAAEARKIFKRIEREYKAKLSVWKKTCQEMREERELQIQQKKAEATASKDKENSLFNKVIKLRGDALEGKDYKYWFVLTYIPDLKWCHLAPMVQEGHFGPERKRSHGRPRYRLVDEKFGKELDISSMYCIPVKSKALKRTVDADKEEWDVIDGPVTLVKEELVIDTNSSSSEGGIGLTKKLSGEIQKTSLPGAISAAKNRLSKEPKFRARTPIKPISGNAIKTTSIASFAQDSLQLTRSSPSRKRSIEKISLEDTVMAEKEMATITSPRQRRRCMRCINNGAPPHQAIECQGAKGRFGKKACEYFGDDGVEKIDENKRNGQDDDDDDDEASDTEIQKEKPAIKLIERYN